MIDKYSDEMNFEEEDIKSLSWKAKLENGETGLTGKMWIPPIDVEVLKTYRQIVFLSVSAARTAILAFFAGDSVTGDAAVGD